MMRVTHISGGTMTGCTRVVLNLLRHHDRSEVSPSVCFFSVKEADPRVVAEVESLGIPWRSVVKRSSRGPGSVLDLRRALTELHPELVAMHGFGAYSFGSLGATLARVPRLVRVEHHPELYGPAYLWSARVASALVDSTITVSQHVARYLDEQRVPKGRWEVVYNGVDLPQFLAIDRPAFSGGGVPVITMAARMDVSKDHATLLRAAALLRDESIPFRLRLSHTGPFAQDVRRQVRELRLEEHVELVGLVPSVPDLLAASDVVVLSTHVEGFGLAVVEGMASARPVVATRIAAVPELFTSGEHGYLVDHESAASLAGALRSLLRNPNHARRLGENARAYAEKRFAIVPSVRGYERHFRATLELRAKPRHPRDLATMHPGGPLSDG